MSYKPCFWFGAPFADYMQLRLGITLRKENPSFLNGTNNTKAAHERFCNTPHNLHLRNWPHATEPWSRDEWSKRLVKDEELRGSMPEPLNQTQIDANMVVESVRSLVSLHAPSSPAAVPALPAAVSAFPAALPAFLAVLSLASRQRQMPRYHHGIYLGTGCSIDRSHWTGNTHGDMITIRTGASSVLSRYQVGVQRL